MVAFPRITRNSDVSEGKPCIRDLRITVGTILGLLASGHSQAQILELYRGLTVDDIREALLYAARRLQEPELPPPAKPAETGKPPVRKLDHVPADVPGKEDRLEFGRAGHEPWIVLTRAGIRDRRLCAHLVAWADIHEITLHTRERPEAVCLELRNPELYLDAMPFRQRVRARFQMLFANPRFLVSSLHTGISARELYVRIKRIWIVYRADTVRQPTEFPHL